MVALAAGYVVTVEFPFSDLSTNKLRPAVVLADAGRGDWILCQLTSNAYSDAEAIQLEDVDFAFGSLSRTSFARPGKIFTASQSLVNKVVGHLTPGAHRRVIQAVVHLLQSNVGIQMQFQPGTVQNLLRMVSAPRA